jgi:hypothetical protein
MKTIITLGIPTGYGLNLPMENFQAINGIDISLITNSFKTIGFDLILPFPKTPATFDVETPNYKYENINPMNFNNLLIPQNIGNTKITFSDFLPNNVYAFNNVFAFNGNKFIMFLEKLKLKGVPLNLWFSNFSKVFEGFITGMDYSYEPNGDVNYNFEFLEQPRIVKTPIKDIRQIINNS